MATVMTTTFQMKGADGGPLRGDVRTASGGAGRPAVVICHGFKGFKDWGFFPKLAERIATAGATAVSFNFTGSGIGPDGESFSEPDRFGHATFSKDIEDIGRVMTALREGSLIPGLEAPSRVGLFGHSRGGGTSIAYLGGVGAADALVTWAAISTVHRWPDGVVASWRESGKLDVPNARTGDILPLHTDVLEDIDEHGNGRLDLLAGAARIKVPWLIVHGAADETVPLDEGRRLREAAPGSAHLTEIEGGAHTFGARHPWAGTTPELSRAMDETVAWFSRHLF